MLFCLSECDKSGRVILDSEPHGNTIAVLEAGTWREARKLALRDKAMDPYTYVNGHGWMDKGNSGML